MSTQLCVSGDTLILTIHGYRSIQHIVDCTIPIWNGEDFSLSSIKKTAAAQSLYLVIMDDGSELKCTYYHSFYVTDGESPCSFKKKELKDLRIGDQIIKCSYPIIHGDARRDFPDAYITGLLTIGGDSYDIPMNASMTNRMTWLSGFLDGNGRLVFKDGWYEIHVDYIFKDFLYNVKLLCNTLQLNPKIRVVSKSVMQLIEQLNGKITYTLSFPPIETACILGNTDFPIQTLSLPATYKVDHLEEHAIRVQSINSLNTKEDVYSFEEPIRGMGILNGVLTGK